MTRDEEPRNPWAWLIPFLVMLVGLTMLCLTSCSPRIVERVVYQRDTTYIEKVRVDSLVQRDSVFIREKGDTIYIYKERVRDRWRLVRDTVTRVKVDSIAVERIKEVKVPVPLSWWQEFKIGAFWWLLGLVLAAVLWIFRKLIF